MSVLSTCMYIFIYMYMFICMHVLIEGRRGYPELLGELELQVILSHSTWVLGLKLGPLEEQEPLL